MENNKFHFRLKLKIPNEEGIFEEKISYVILSQLRLLSSKRMIRRLAHINDNVFKEVEEKLILLIKGNENGPLSGSSGA
ncbi:MAG: type II toxin-antitoxin system PemK/MazF family toxin [Patescibacteria group bacterium]